MDFCLVFSSVYIAIFVVNISNYVISTKKCKFLKKGVDKREEI